MRIVGGQFAGWDLTSPNDARVRPTAELVRAAMLDRLAEVLKQARILDLFAGTGALGLEALSRGAATADFVETRPASLHALKANIVTLRARDRTRVFRKDALPFAAALPEGSYDIAFVDPPYGSRMLDRVIEGWQRTRFSTLLVAEHATTHTLPSGAEFRRFGETSVSFYGLPAARRPTRARPGA
jgi:16S rRNA (guanine966-N2)-methyltransferase